MTTPLNDDEIAALYKKATASDAPATDVDNAILAAAHKAVGARPQAVNAPLSAPKPSYLQRWQIPMSLAATIVLSFSLVTFMAQENPDLVWQAEPSAAPTAPEEAAPLPEPAPEAAASTQAAPEAALPKAMPAKAMPAEVKPQTNLDQTALPKKIAQPEIIAQAETPEKAKKIDNKPAKQAVAKPFSDIPTAPTTVAAPAPELNAEISATAPVPQASPVRQASPAPQTSPKPIEAKPEAAASAQSDAADEGAALDKNEMEASDATMQSQTKADETFARKQSAPSANTEAASGAMSENAPAASPASRAAAEPLPPEIWLKNIDTLRKNGQVDAARKSLKAFKLHYPDYALPKDLIDFEQQ